MQIIEQSCKFSRNEGVARLFTSLNKVRDYTEVLYLLERYMDQMSFNNRGIIMKHSNPEKFSFITLQ